MECCAQQWKQQTQEVFRLITKIEFDIIGPISGDFPFFFLYFHSIHVPLGDHFSRLFKPVNTNKIHAEKREWKSEKPKIAASGKEYIDGYSF